MLIALILTVGFSPQMQSYYRISANHKISIGDTFGLSLVFPDRMLKYVRMSLKDENGFKEKILLGLNKTAKFARSGIYQGKLSLFGIIPLKNIKVNVLPAVKVYPSGHSIGVLVKAQGVMVVGFSGIDIQNNKVVFPAKEQGVQIGDIISKANNVPIKSDKELEKLINQTVKENKQLRLEIIRNGSIIKLNVKPEKSLETERNRIGLYVRDTAAGVGTLTFIEPSYKGYGALGHMIANTEINEQLNEGMGKIVSASINRIVMGKKGIPGEKIGNFNSHDIISGAILKNSTYGIYGILDVPPLSYYYREPLPIAYAGQIEEGSAHILTVLEGDQIEKFTIEIEKVLPYQKPTGKGLVIKVTDRDLLARTGGIVQGMSGSPIIQNGRLVGAITHVFIQDPTRGYGILAEWMIEEIGTITQELLSAS